MEKININSQKQDQNNLVEIDFLEKEDYQKYQNSSISKSALNTIAKIERALLFNILYQDDNRYKDALNICSKYPWKTGQNITLWNIINRLIQKGKTVKINANSDLLREDDISLVGGLKFLEGIAKESVKSGLNNKTPRELLKSIEDTIAKDLQKENKENNTEDDDQEIEKIPYVPGSDIETDIKYRFQALSVSVRFNTRDQIEEFKTGDDNWKILDDGIDAKLYSDCHRKLKPWPGKKLKKISHSDWQTHTKALVHRKEVDPFKVWLEDLPKWDGQARLEGVLPLLFKIKGNEKLAKWAFKSVLLTAIKRTFKPGYKFDSMIVLQGPQGVGKSSLWSCLFAQDSWFSDNIHFSGRDKEIIETTSGTVLVENAELAGARRAELEKIKALITRQVDKVRFAYARKVSLLPRQFVIVGTTNEPCSLPNDQTGNRRFVPISIDKKADTAWNNGKQVRDYITQNRKQLWSEALHLFKHKESPLMPIKLHGEAEKAAEKHRSKNELLEEAVLKKINMHPKGIKISLIADYLMDKKIIPSGGAHSGIQREIGAILRKNGWELKKDRNGRWWIPGAHGSASTDSSDA